MIYFSFLFHHQVTHNLLPQVARDDHLLILGADETQDWQCSFLER